MEPRPVEIVITSTQIRVIDAESADELKVCGAVAVYVCVMTCPEAYSLISAR